MLHSNAGELHQLFSTFNRVWGAGGDASLSLKTVDGKVSAVLEIQLGPPSAPRPGAPEAQQQAAGNWNQQPGQHRSQRRRGPGRQARDAARRKAWKNRRQEVQPFLIPPPPPALPPRRLVTVIKENTNRSSFCKLNGEAREEPTKPEGKGEVKASDGRQELHCHCLDDPNYEYDPNNDEDRCLIWTPPDGCTSTDICCNSDCVAFHGNPKG